MDRIVEIKDQEIISNVFGNFDENVKLVERDCGVRIIYRDGMIKISGDEKETDLAMRTIESLIGIARQGDRVNAQNVNYVMGMLKEESGENIITLSSNAVCVTAKGKVVKAKTVGQAKYVESIVKNPIVFGIGPAGTGKTYLAVAAAVNELRNKNISRIILTRPAIEAGEKLGFLPGDLQNKVDPYLRPLYDALHDMLGAETCQNYLEKGIIEVAPLAYMRGRTLDDSFIILDEAQNTTNEQMKMFLTRIGFSSRAVITGDVTQIDLPREKASGLKDVQQILKNIEGVEFCYLTSKDVIRHPLVQKIIVAYEKFQKEAPKRRTPRR